MADKGIVYTSRSRIATKTSLPKVLLASNPQMDRELRKKLNSIQISQQRRERTLDWNQRQFLVHQIFDEDYNLRFTLHQNNRCLDKSVGQVSGRVGNVQHNGRSFEKSSKRMTTGAKLGIFLPPLHPSQRLIERKHIRKTETTKKPTFFSRETDHNHQNNSFNGVDPIHQKLDQLEPKMSSNQNALTSLNAGKKSKELEEKSKLSVYLTDESIESVTSKAVRRRYFSAKEEVSVDDDQLQTKMGRKVRSFSCVEDISKVKMEDTQKSELLLTQTLPSDRDNPDSKIKSPTSIEDEDEVLCDDKIVTNLTRTLPISLMIKANKNINRVVAKRQRLMIDRCRQSYDKSLLSDPRWSELEGLLRERNKSAILKTRQDAQRALLLGYE